MPIFQEEDQKEVLPSFFEERIRLQSPHLPLYFLVLSNGKNNLYRFKMNWDTYVVVSFILLQFVVMNELFSLIWFVFVSVAILLLDFIIIQGWHKLLGSNWTTQESIWLSPTQKGNNLSCSPLIFLNIKRMTIIRKVKCHLITKIKRWTYAIVNQISTIYLSRMNIQLINKTQKLRFVPTSQEPRAYQLSQFKSVKSFSSHW